MAVDVESSTTLYSVFVSSPLLFLYYTPTTTKHAFKTRPVNTMPHTTTIYVTIVFVLGQYTHDNVFIYIYSFVSTCGYSKYLFILVLCHYHPILTIQFCACID